MQNNPTQEGCRVRFPSFHSFLIHNIYFSLGSLSREEHLIYTRIQQAGNTGIWAQQLQKAANIPPNAFNKAVNSLETKKHIKRVKAVKVSPSKTELMGAKAKIKNHPHAL